MKRINRVKASYIAFISLSLVLLVTCIFSYRYVTAINVYSESIEYEESGQLADAKKGYLEVLRLDPWHDGANYQLGVIARKEGRIEDAKRFMGQAIKLNNGESGYYLGLGHLYFNDIGNIAKAKIYFKRAHALNNKNYYVCLMLGKIEEGENNEDRAIVYYKKAIKANPSLTVAYKKIALIYGIKGMRKEAKKYWKSVNILDPKDEDALSNLGSTF